MVRRWQPMQVVQQAHVLHCHGQDAVPWAGGASKASLVCFLDSFLSPAASPASPMCRPRPSLCNKRQTACVCRMSKRSSVFHCRPGLVQRPCRKQKRWMLGLCNLKFHWTGKKLSDLQTIQHSKLKLLSSRPFHFLVCIICISVSVK